MGTYQLGRRLVAASGIVEAHLASCEGRWLVLSRLSPPWTQDATFLDRFGVQAQALSTEPTAPKVLRPRFEGDAAGWTLRATQDEGAQAPALQLQGSRLLDRETGLPWVPQRWELTAPDGTRYSLDAAGRIDDRSVKAHLKRLDRHV